ncbi:glucose-1-phosphate cytidylyltransferase [Maridesulfovibrio ferrireducens]|uniref:Glucose-1-phosphate cytidylyltransferase n=1 Tax=Maridesulfovibrio ferrireducens TaxID=246191 RepID=A0A1G9CNU0_9BACT|nr:glucose-1-phosphate cytidylyltransferase [Maridesulfovibrio ferrireducens]SDK53249.1 glucose-1-phosphate cytidylyltransferase [Maridesulfovibrio ferrireducens]
MKTVLLAGGYGTRISEESATRPKPMVEIGGRPILWHIMEMYASHGYNDFVVACGYKSAYIKQYFSSVTQQLNNLSINLGTGVIETIGKHAPDWKVTLMDTGLNTMTGGRLRRLAPYLDSTFMVTYGDGVSNVDITKLVEFHKSHGKLATVTAVRPPARFGSLILDDSKVKCFSEKNPVSEGWINGGFFVLEPEVLDYISGDEVPFETDPLSNLSKDGQLMAYLHDGFWKCMDTLRDKVQLEQMWQKGDAPWMLR